MRRNSLFDDFFNGDLFDVNASKSGNFTMPSVNVKETEQNFEIQLAAPGMKKADFNINIDKNLLTISSEMKTENEEKDEEGRFTRREFNYQSFKRSFALPETVEQEKIEAAYEEGILKISIPKKEKTVAASRSIEIK